VSGVEGFAMVPNWLIRESGVSGYAICVFAALASHSGKGGIFPSQETLAVEARCSVRKVRESLTELVRVGAVKRIHRSSRVGRLSDGYEIAVNGALGAADQQPASGAGRGQQPAHGAAATGTSVQTVPLIEEEPIEEDAPIVPTVDSLFEEAWKAWPKRTEKKLSRERFERALKTRPQLLEDVRRFGEAYARTTEAQYVPALAVWIGRERWTDDLPVGRAASRTTVDIGRDADAILRARESNQLAVSA